MPQVWDSRLHVVKNSLKFEMCVVLGCSSPQCYHYHNNLFLLLSFSFKKNLLSNMLKYVSCVNRHFIVPLFFVCIYRTRSFPFSTLCHQENLSTILHFQGVFKGGTVAICSLIIYFQVSTFATIWECRDLLHWNQHKFHIFVCRAKQNLIWPGLNFPFGCAKLLIWHSFYLVSSPWMSFQKFFLPKWRCIFWC